MTTVLYLKLAYFGCWFERLPYPSAFTLVEGVTIKLFEPSTPLIVTGCGKRQLSSRTDSLQLNVVHSSVQLG